MASENNLWFVGTNKSTQGKKDPLPYDVKIKAMEALWPEVEGHIVPETNLFTLASKVFKEHGEVSVVVYTDEDWLTKTLEKYNGEEGKHGYYKFSSIEQKPTPRLSSATDVRNAVLSDDREAFERAAGVPADFKIDGKDYFDLVAEYLLPHHTKESVKSDKYIQQQNIEESQMNLNELRKLAGLPLNESAPVEFKPGYAMSDVDKKLADIGRILMDMAAKEKDDTLSNAMSELGGSLADGSVSSQEDLVSFIKGTDADAATLSDRTTKAIAAYNSGERAVGAKPGEEPEGDFDEPEDEEMMDSVDLSDLRGEYDIEEGFDVEEIVNRISDEEGFSDSDRKDLLIVAKRDGAQSEDDVWNLAWQLGVGTDHEEDMDEAAVGPAGREGEFNDTVNQYISQLEDSGLYGDPDVAQAFKHFASGDYEAAAEEIVGAFSQSSGGEGDVDGVYNDLLDDLEFIAKGGKNEAVEETASNAMDAAMAELRKLAGL